MSMIIELLRLRGSSWSLKAFDYSKMLQLTFADYFETIPDNWYLPISIGYGSICMRVNPFASRKALIKCLSFLLNPMSLALAKKNYDYCTILNIVKKKKTHHNKKTANNIFDPIEHATLLNGHLLSEADLSLVKSESSIIIDIYLKFH